MAFALRSEAVVERLKQERMYGLSAGTQISGLCVEVSGRCREVKTRVNVWTVRWDTNKWPLR